MVCSSHYQYDIVWQSLLSKIFLSGQLSEHRLLLLAPVASKFSWLLPQKPPKRRQTSKAPNPIRKEPPRKAISFGVCTIGMRAEPMRISPGNLKQIWSSNMSVDCSFAVNCPSIYVNSWNKRNSLRHHNSRVSTELALVLVGKGVGRAAFWRFSEELWQLRPTIHRQFVNIPQMGDVARRLQSEGGITRSPF